jgi:peptide/nickel transport system substrate-binding protein
VKQAAAKAGIEMELKSVVPSVYFSADPGNVDTVAQFSADIQMCSWQFGVDPQRSLEVSASWELARKANKWAGRNTTRWRNEEYDRLWKASGTELDPVKRAAIFIRLNDLVIQHVVFIPVLWRKWVSALALSLKGTDVSGWDSSFWNLAHWHRSA